MSMITIIQVNPRLTSTFGPLPVIGAQRLMEDMIPSLLALYRPPIIPLARGLWGIVLPPLRANFVPTKVHTPSRRP